MITVLAKKKTYKGVLINKNWMLVDNVLYNVKKKENSTENEFIVAMEFNMLGNTVVNILHYDKVPVGVMRKAKALYKHSVTNGEKQ